VGHFFIDRRLRYCPEPDRYYYNENGKTRPAVSFRQLRLSVFAGNAVLRVRCSTHSGPQGGCDFILIRPGSMINARNQSRRLFPSLMVAVCLMLSCRDATKERIEQLKAGVRSEVPPSRGSDDVIAYLDRNHIEHSEYTKAGDTEELRLLGAPGRIDGIIRKVGSSVVARSDITLVFLFDQQGKMQSYAISEVVTGP
jgi:hypothetical protein